MPKVEHEWNGIAAFFKKELSANDIKTPAFKRATALKYELSPPPWSAAEVALCIESAA